MGAGAEVFDAFLWAGRLAEAAHRVPVVLLPRRAVKPTLCGDSRAKDANIRRALLDRFGGSAAAPDPLYLRRERLAVAPDSASVNVCRSPPTSTTNIRFS